MGYTHYYRMNGHIVDEDYKKIRRDFEGLIPLFFTLHHVKLAGWDGNGEATLDDDEIRPRTRNNELRDKYARF